MCSTKRYREFNVLLGVKVIHLIDRADLFKLSNLVLGGEVIVTDMYSSLEGERESEKVRDRERGRVIERGKRPVRHEEIMLVTALEQQ
jgi:hypothetical protein